MSEHERLNKVEETQISQGQSIVILQQIADSIVKHNKKMEDKIDNLSKNITDQQSTLLVIAEFRNRVEKQTEAFETRWDKHDREHADFDKKYGAFLDRGIRLTEKAVDSVATSFFKIFFWVVMTLAVIVFGSNML